jgi:hypothetical protein
LLAIVVLLVQGGEGALHSFDERRMPGSTRETKGRSDQAVKPARTLDQSNIGMLHNYRVARYNKRTWQNANQMLCPYMATLAAKWGMSETQFEETFADETKYGKLDVLATVDGQVVNKPR